MLRHVVCHMLHVCHMVWHNQVCHSMQGQKWYNVNITMCILVLHLQQMDELGRTSLVHSMTKNRSELNSQSFNTFYIKQDWNDFLGFQWCFLEPKNVWKSGAGKWQWGSWRPLASGIIHPRATQSNFHTFRIGVFVFLWLCIWHQWQSIQRPSTQIFITYFIFPPALRSYHNNKMELARIFPLPMNIS